MAKYVSINDLQAAFAALEMKAQEMNKPGIAGFDLDGKFVALESQVGGGDPDPTLNYYWTMAWTKTGGLSGTMNFNMGLRFRTEPDYAFLAGLAWTDNWTQSNHILVFVPQSTMFRIQFSAFTQALDYQFPGPYQYICPGSGNVIDYATPVYSSTVDPGGNSEPDNT